MDRTLILHSLLDCLARQTWSDAASANAGHHDFQHLHYTNEMKELINTIEEWVYEERRIAAENS